MNWFEDLFGSLENPVFLPDYVASYFTVYSHSPSTYFASQDTYIVDFVDIGYTGWLIDAKENQSTYIYGSVIRDETYATRLLQAYPVKKGFPHRIILTNRNDGFIIDAWFGDIHPYYGSVWVKDGAIVHRNHFYSDLPNMQFENEVSFKLHGNEFDLLSTEFIHDPVVRLSYLAALQSHDINAIRNLMKSNGCEIGNV